jgi:hypothetical protein
MVPKSVDLQEEDHVKRAFEQNGAAILVRWLVHDAPSKD